MATDVAKDFIDTLDSPFKIKTSHAVFTKLSEYAETQNTTIEDILSNPEKLEDFKSFLKENISKGSLRNYISLVEQIENWFNQRSDTSKVETPKPEKQIVTPKPSTIKTLQCDRLNITLTPYYDQKKKTYYVDCPKEIFKKDKFGNWIPTGKTQGERTAQFCELCNQRYQAYLKRKEKKEAERQEATIKEERAEEGNEYLRKRRELGLWKPQKELGVCLNLIRLNTYKKQFGQDPTECWSCKVEDYPKWRACQELREELRTDPILQRKLSEKLIEITLQERSRLTKEDEITDEIMFKTYDLWHPIYNPKDICSECTNNGKLKCKNKEYAIFHATLEGIVIECPSYENEKTFPHIHTKLEKMPVETTFEQTISMPQKVLTE